MDENHHIDDSFKQRFSDIKDHSVNPTEQWLQFESQLAKTAAAGAGAGTSSFAGASMLKMAASFVSVIALSGLATQDITEINSQVESFNNQFFNASSEFISEEISSVDHNSVNTVAFTNQANEFHAALDESPLLANLTEEEEPVQSEEVYYSPKSKRFSISRMLGLKKDQFKVGLADANRNLSHEYVDPAFFSPVSYYARAAIRIGNGESNSKVVANTPTLNGVLGVGMTYDLSPSTFISLEANLLTRSGNGIERSKDYDFEPIISAMPNSTVASANELGSDFRVQKSLVADHLRYLHVPMLVHVILNQQSNASIGAYTDYLLSARNETYMIYDSEHYVATGTFFGDEKSKKGLNVLRYGLIAGYQHSINSRVLIDARAMIPITSSYDRSSEYDIEREPNQLFDFNIGLIYKI